MRLHGKDEACSHQLPSATVLDPTCNFSPSMNANNQPVAEQSTMMLGDLIAQLDNPELTTKVLTTLDPDISRSIEERARSLSMSSAEFSAAAVREFVEWADDDQWSQLLVHMKKADDPGLRAVQAILCWVVSDQ